MGLSANAFILLTGPFLDKHGPRLTLALAAMATFIGYILMHFTIKHKLNDGFICSAIYFLLIGIGANTGYMTTIAVNLSNFKDDRVRGMTLGILLLFSGLSATFYSQIYKNSFSKEGMNTAGYFLFCAISLATINLIAAWFIKKEDPAELMEKSVVTLDPEQVPKILVKGKSYDALGAKESTKQRLAHEREQIQTALSSSKWNIFKFPVFWYVALIFMWKQGYTYILNVSTITRSIASPTNASDPLYIVSEGATHVTIMSIAQAISRFVLAN
jgi:MFS family permease